MKRVIIVAGLLYATPILGFAQSVGAPPGGYSFTNFGAAAEVCSAWTKARNTGLALPEELWIEGFITGTEAALGVARKTNVSISKSPNEIFVWLDAYCSQHENATLGQAGAEFTLANITYNIPSH